MEEKIMNEEELNNMFESAEVIKRASQTPPLGMVGEDKDVAKGLWIAIQICFWLRNWKGRQYLRIMKINTWTNQETIIDLLIGHSGKYDSFRLITNRIANDLIFLRIAHPEEKGDLHLEGKSFKSVWESFGVEMTDDESDDMVIETLPKGEKTGKKSPFRPH
jgi:hypothetical protein